ncbi:MAG: hypothetical protein WD772_05890, partial [Pseudohongiellaceae bacterium]
VFGNSQNVESTAVPAGVGVALQEVLGAANEFQLFTPVDRLNRIAKQCTAAPSDFNENQLGTVQHDQIYFTHPALVISQQ